jgi:6-phosphogluconolactonase (cycloisomerase 2 family)
MTMKVRGVLSLVVAAAAMWLTSCGHYTCGATFGNSSCSSTGGGITQGPNTSGSGTVFAFLLVESNTAPVGMAADSLDLATNKFDLAVSFAAPPLPLSPAIDGGTAVVSLTSKKYLYIPFNDSTLFGYAIDGTSGALTSVPNSPYIATGGTSITADPSGRFLFVSDFASGDITAFTINANDGSLTPVPGSPFLSGIVAAQMTTDGQGKFLYATEGLGGVHLAAFSINQTSGALTTVAGSPFAFDMAQVEGEKSGKFLLGISGIDSKIHVFGINSTSGVIAEVANSPFTTVSAPSSLVVHPTGSFVYTFHAAGTAMEGYQISATSGALTAIAGSPFGTAALDVGQFDQSGKFLFGVGVGAVGLPTFGPYDTDPTTGIVSATTFQLGGFPGSGFAISDLDSAP